MKRLKIGGKGSQLNYRKVQKKVTNLICMNLSFVNQKTSMKCRILLPFRESGKMEYDK